MNILSGAVMLTVVVYAILNRAIDALDVLFALALIVHHNNNTSFWICSDSLPVAFTAVGRISAICR